MGHKRRKRDRSLQGETKRKYRRALERPEFVIAPLLLLGMSFLFVVICSFDGPPDRTDWRFKTPRDRFERSVNYALGQIPSWISHVTGMSLTMSRLLLVAIGLFCFALIGVFVWWLRRVKNAKREATVVQ